MPGAPWPTKLAPAFASIDWSTARTLRPAERALASVCPTAATCGSVKITRGDSAPSERSAPGRPRIVSATRRAWYLPMCVSSTRPLASPTTYSQSSPGTRSCSSTSM